MSFCQAQLEYFPPLPNRIFSEIDVIEKINDARNFVLNYTRKEHSDHSCKLSVDRCRAIIDAAKKDYNARKDDYEKSFEEYKDKIKQKTPFDWFLHCYRNVEEPEILQRIVAENSIAFISETPGDKCAFARIMGFDCLRCFLEYGCDYVSPSWEEYDVISRDVTLYQITRLHDGDESCLSCEHSPVCPLYNK